MQAGSFYLSRTWCLYTWSYLDILIIIHFSINCSTVICSPIVILMLSWEKPLVKPMAHGSIFLHISFQSILLSIYIIKIPKIFILLLSSLSDLTRASGREGIDNPFIALVARFSVCLCRCVGLLRSLLLDWYLGSRKTEGNTYATLLHHPFLFKGKPMQCSSLLIFTHYHMGQHMKIQNTSWQGIMWTGWPVN